MFGCNRYGYLPDMITCAKGMTSGYSPIGAMIASDRLMEPFLSGAHDLRARRHLRGPPGLVGGRARQSRLLERENILGNVREQARQPSARRSTS